MPLTFREAIALYIPDSLDLQEVAVDYLRGYLGQHCTGIAQCLLYARIYCASEMDGSCVLWVQYPPEQLAQIGWAMHWEKLDRLADLWHLITGLNRIVVIGRDIGKLVVTLGQDPVTGCQVCDRAVIGSGGSND